MNRYGGIFAKSAGAGGTAIQASGSMIEDEIASAHRGGFGAHGEHCGRAAAGR